MKRGWKRAKERMKQREAWSLGRMKQREAWSLGDEEARE